MSERLKLLIACAFLGLCGLIALPGLAGFGRSASRRPTPPVEPAAARSAAVEEPGAAAAADLVELYGRHDGSALPDAFAPPPAPVPLPEHRVALVYLSGGRPLAVIDERIVGVADVLDAGEVISIGQEGVAVRRDGATWLYRLGEPGPPVSLASPTDGAPAPDLR
jgi:hypothetical protein